MTAQNRLSKWDWVRLALIALIIIGAALRLYNLNWDEYQHAHPDERHVTWVATSITWPKDVGTLFDPLRTTINPFRWPPTTHPPAGQPRAFTYGHFPLYMLSATAQTLSVIFAPADGGRWSDYDHIQLVGRALSGLWDALTILLIYLLGKELYGRRIGLLAAAFQTFAVLHIQLSHFATFDAIMATFVVMAILFAARGIQRGRTLDFILAGVAGGLAIGSLARALPILLPVALAPLIHLLKVSGNPLKWEQWDIVRRRLAWRLIALALAVPLLALLVFVATNPFSLLDIQSFLKDVGEQSRMVRGVVDFPFTRQYRFTTPFLYQIEQQVRWGLGWPLGIAGFLGMGWAVWRAIRGRLLPAEWVVLVWFIPYFAINGAFMVKFMRYMVILTPFLCLFAGHLIGSLIRWLGKIDAARFPRMRIIAGNQGNGLGLSIQFSFARISERSWHIARQWLGIALIIIPFGWTVIYALGFTSIYTRPHTWITASKWIYNNVPRGSVIAVEHWDDEMPKPLRGPGLSSSDLGYQHVTLPLYEEDTAGKYHIIKEALSKADYVILATNRLYRSIPRLPKRYPMTIKYYDLLFAGELGFELIQEFTSYPQLGPFRWIDDDADESFTVYDHPKPLIFKKVRQLSEEEWSSKLGDSWRGAIPGWVGDKAKAGQSKTETPKKSLMLKQPVDQLPIVDDFRWNRLASQSAPLAIIIWWLALTIVGLAAAPVAFVALGRLRDRGWALSKTLGLLLVGYLNWIGASLHITQNRAWVIALFLLLLAGFSAFLFKQRREEILAFLRERWRLILVIEVLFTLAYLVFVCLRLFNPDLWQPWSGGEKSMEFAFLNAVLKSAYFVPYDPYFAGGTLNYYYYGQYLISILIKLTGIMPSVAFNLAIPSLFAMTVSGAFCVAYTLAAGFQRAVKGGLSWSVGIAQGLLAALFVAVIGNLQALNQVVHTLGRLGGSDFQSNIPGVQALVRLIPGIIAVIGGRPMPRFDYWDVSRVIPNSINEFPFWSFLFADLHPHMIAIPFTILTLGIVLDMVLRPAARSQKDQPYAVATIANYLPTGPEVLSWLLLILGVGVLGPLNTWDLPTYLGLSILAYAMRVGRPGERINGLLRTTLFALFLIAGSLLLYWPFYHHYAAMSVGVGIVKDKTDGWLWCIVWGLFIFLTFTFYLVELRRPGERLPLLRLVRLALTYWEKLPRLGDLHQTLVRGDRWYQAGRLGLVMALVSVVVFAALGYWTIAITLLPLIGGALLFMRRQANLEESFVNLLFFTAFLVLWGVEVFFLKDFLQGGELYRMNTLFKFFIQAWVMLGVACGVTLPTIWDAVEAWRSRPWRIGWQIAAAGLIIAALLFLPMGVPERLRDRFPNASPPIGTLDGMAYMRVGSYTWPDPSYRIDMQYDYEAIHWLIDNVRGTPVIAEAPISYYREGGLRVSSYTGLPTLVGMHQNEQRYGDVVAQREDQARQLFHTEDPAKAMTLIRQLNVSFIYIGPVERIPKLFSPAGLAKFDQMAREGMLVEVYRNPQVTIYAVPEKLAALKQ